MTSNRIMKRYTYPSTFYITYDDFAFIRIEIIYVSISLIHTLFTVNKTICIYSGDGDMIPLSIVSNKNNIFLMMGADRIIGEQPGYEDKPYVYLNIDEVKKSLHYKLNKGMNKNSHINVNDFTLDYAFLLSLGGNDFIHGLPFTVVKNQGIDE